MVNNSTVSDQSYPLFVSEAHDLLQVIEQELLTLKDDRTLPKVHSLMRAAHTLKGAAASVGLETMTRIAHALEDVFKSLYNPEVVLDAELESLLFESYECLRLCLQAADTQGFQGDRAMQPAEEILNRVATIISQIQTKLGDFFDQEAALPSSEELGFDITQSIFESGVDQRLTQLAQTLQTTNDSAQIATELRSYAEIFLGLAESLNLPGWGAIAHGTLAALEAHPQQAIAIAAAALADWQQGHAAVLAGDRTQGGTVSPALKQWSVINPAGSADPVPLTDDLSSLLSEIQTHFETYPGQDPPLTTMEPEAANPVDLETDSALAAAFEEMFGQTTASPQPPPADRPIPDPADDTSAPRRGDRPHTPTAPVSPQGSDRPHPSAPAIPPTAPSSPSTSQATSPSTSQATSLSTSLSAPSPISASPPPINSAANSAPQPESGALSMSSSQAMIRVNVGRLAQLNRLSGELLTNQNRQTAEIGQAQKIIREVVQLVQNQQHTLNTMQDWADQRRFKHSYAKLKNGSPQSTAEPSRVGDRSAAAAVSTIAPLGALLQFDTLEFDHYSELDLLLQSALERRTQIETRVETLSLLIQQSDHSLEKQRRLLTEVRDDLTLARMQPLGEVLNRFQRILQQLTTARHKPVTLSLQGTDVLIERAIADKLYDPLLHLIRNAFDHGIETPEIRRQQGKPATGQIQIRAHQKGNRTIIEVQDDGKGIDFQSIRQRAIELNRLSPKQAGQLPEAQLVELLFEPGFSTASKLTDLSGRGIGLDVVLSQIRALNGSVTVQSQLQQGTTFSLHLPSTLTITKLMLCHANGMTYALTIDVIDQVILPNPNQIHRLNGQKALSWRKENTDYLIPIWKLSDLVTYSTQASPTPQTSHDLAATPGLRLHQNTPQSTILLLNHANQLLGLEVDHVLGEQELVIRP
ncbi:MAG TPA: chemotaxis protein CheA, partial [Chroococcidiopsis sp.]